MIWELWLERHTKNILNPETTKKKIRDIAGVVQKHKSMGFGVKVAQLPDEPPLVDSPDGSGEMVHHYLIKFTVSKSNVPEGDEEKIKNQFENIYDHIVRFANRNSWNIKKGETLIEAEAQSSSANTYRPPFVLPKLTKDDWDMYFGEIYERNPHIRIIYDSAKVFAKSGGKQRSSVLLYGPPAGGKTSLFERFKMFIEQDSEVERVALIDGPTMSKAGLENWLINHAEAGTLPEFLILEEIEKQDMNNMLTMLSLMSSGYVSKTNARIGRVHAAAKMVIWATCNDEKKLKEFRDGALYSRFVHKLYCKRPSQALMKKILSNKVAEIGGDQRWVNEVMEFAYEDYKVIFGHEMLDPRQIIGLLDGENRLLDGSYQEDLKEIWYAEEQDKSLMQEPEKESVFESAY